jgi:hypothetical protein
MPWEQAQGLGPSWYVPAFCVTAKIMLFCVDVEVSLYVNGRTEAEGVEGRALRRVFGLRVEVTGDWRTLHKEFDYIICTPYQILFGCPYEEG